MMAVGWMVMRSYKRLRGRDALATAGETPALRSRTVPSTYWFHGIRVLGLLDAAAYQLASHCGFRYALFADESFAFHAHGIHAPRLHFDFDAHLVARNYGAAEARSLNAGE